VDLSKRARLLETRRATWRSPLATGEGRRRRFRHKDAGRNPTTDERLTALPSQELLVLHETIMTVVALASLATTPAAQHHHLATATDTATANDIRLTRVRLRTGLALEVAQRGRSDGHPVLFLHGFTDSWFSFTPMLERLPAGIRAVVPSQRGHGDSERPACCYSIGDFTADAIALLHELGIERSTVVGHSMGSFIAQRVAIEYPERVDRLVLIGSGVTARTEAATGFAEVVRTLSDPVAPAFVREFQQSTLTRPVAPAACAWRRVVISAAVRSIEPS
jgi:pimeloyl-ACP methyl ester carboxylesterase